VNVVAAERVSSSGFTMPLELRLLGAPAVLLDGEEVPLATRKALALVAYLALEGVTPRGKLADVLWSDMSEDAARNNLRKELFRLRETPLRDALQVSPTKLELSAQVSVDAMRFVHASAAGDESALEMYGGALLEGLELTGAAGFEAWLEDKRPVVTEARQKLLEARAARLESAGDWRGALEARRALLEMDVLQESHHREIMELHWRLGERGAALEAFDRLAQTLERELGLTPLPETLTLLSRIQRGAAEEPSHPQPVPSSLPNLSRPPLVGRETAWHWLTARGDGLSLILGEVGVGKTRLAEDALEPALTLRGFESARGTPLYPVAEALRGALPRLQGLEDIWRLEVARLLPELLRSGEREAVASSDGRARFLEALTRAVTLALGEHGTLLLDDLHLFDPSSLEFVTHLVRRAPERRFVATARQFELLENTDAQNTLVSLERDGLLARLEMAAFTEAQTLSLLQSLSGGSARLFARRLQEATGGNALFTLETLRGLFESGSLQLEADGAWVTPFDDATEDYTELPIPPNVLELALRRVTHLGGAVRRSLEVAALCGEPFEMNDLSGATALSEWEQLEALERALSAQVVRLEPRGYRFSHDVLRRSLLSAQSLERQRLTHRRLADTLIRNAAAPARIARHLELGGRETEAAPWHVRAAETASAVYAHLEARRHYERALELTPDPRAAYRIHTALADLELTLLQLDAYEQRAETMIAIARSLNDQPLETSARLLRAKALLYRGQYKTALEEANGIVTEAHLETLPEALTVLGTALIGCGQLQDAEPHLRRVLEIAPPRHPFIGEAHALLKEIYRQQGNLERALQEAELARAAHALLGKHESELTMGAQVGQILGLLGRTDEGIDTLEHAVEQARTLGLERVLTVALVLLSEQQLYTGRWVAAERTIHEGLALTRGKMLAREYQLTGMLARVQQHTGQLREAMRTAKNALQLSEQLGNSMQKAPALSLVAEISLYLQDLPTAQIHLELLRALTVAAQSSAYDAHLHLLEAKLHLERGELDAARTLVRRVHGASLLAQANYRALFEELKARLT
jgi:DNA-binding SARP family transcriptional activator